MMIHLVAVVKKAWDTYKVPWMQIHNDHHQHWRIGSHFMKRLWIYAQSGFIQASHHTVVVSLAYARELIRGDTFGPLMLRYLNSYKIFIWFVWLDMAPVSHICDI